MKKTLDKNLILALFLIIIESLAIKIFMYDLLPDKYFYDSNRIMSIMNGSTLTDKAYTYTANFFSRINFLNFTTLEEWGFFISILFIIVISIILIKQKSYTLSQYIFIFVSIALLNIYVFNVSKDFVQFLYFFAIFIILSTKKLSNFKKLILSSLILLYEALNFRVYYALMGMLMVTIYFIYVKFIRGKSLNKKHAFKILFLAYLFFFIEVFIVHIVSQENYIAIIQARSSVNQYRIGDVDAVTMIIDLLGENTTYLTFVGNYIINTFRLMIPLELLTKGISYIPFIIYQLFITYHLVKTCTKMNDQNILWLSTIISFMMVSIIFEPDFGSFIRHESALTLFLLQIHQFYLENKRSKKEETHEKDSIV